MASLVLVIAAVLARLPLLTSGQQGLTLSLRGRSIAASSDVNISDIGESLDSALVCTTDLQACCVGSVRRGAGEGNWVDQNTNATIGARNDGGDLYVTRSSEREVLLSRRNNTLAPLGTYCCEVMTEDSPNNNDVICVNLVVPPPPKLTVVLSGNGSLIVGSESYTLTCTASRGTTPTYQWTRNGKLVTASSNIFFSQLSQNSTETSQALTFSPLSQANSGEYTCTVTRDSMSVSSTTRIHVTVPALFGVISRSGTPTEDRPYTLTCIVSGHQALMATLTYIWTNNSNTITTNNQYTFSPINRYDNGIYTCRVSIMSPLINRIIARQSSIKIEVTVLLTAQPLIAVISKGNRSFVLSWTQPSSGGRADSYTLQYTASGRDCSKQSQGGPISLPGTQRSFCITDLEENCDAVINITATNIRGSSSAVVTTKTTMTDVPDYTLVIIGGAAAIILTLALATIVISIILARKRRKKMSQQSSHAREPDDESLYEVVQTDGKGIKHDYDDPVKKEEFALEVCPAYSSVGTRLK